MITEKIELDNSKNEYGEDRIEELRKELKELRDKMREKIKNEETYSITELKKLKAGSLESASDEDINAIPKEILELWDRLKKAEITDDGNQNEWVDQIDSVLKTYKSPVNLREIFGDIIAEKRIKFFTNERE